MGEQGPHSPLWMNEAYGPEWHYRVVEAHKAVAK